MLVARQQFRSDLRQRLELFVLWRNDRVAYLPVNLQLWIAPQHSVLVLRIINVAALIEKLGGVGKHGKAVGKSRGNVDLLLILRREHGANPLSERGRPAP